MGTQELSHNNIIGQCVRPLNRLIVCYWYTNANNAYHPIYTLATCFQCIPPGIGNWICKTTNIS